MSIEIFVRRSRVRLPPPNMISYAEKLYNEREYFREKTIIISVKMSESLFEKLEEYRRKKHISRSKAIRDAVERLMMVNK